MIKANDDLTPEHHQFFLYQMLRGLKYIHSGTCDNDDNDDNDDDDDDDDRVWCMWTSVCVCVHVYVHVCV